VVDEILSNALKYAFPGQRRGEIRVCLQRQPDGQIRLSIADNGVGMESPEALRGSRTLGVQTVLGITEHQLSARVTLETRGGVSWEVIFDDSRYQTRV